MQNMRSSICGREAGFIVGETNPLEFTFVSSKELLPPRLEYLVVPGVEERGGGGVPTSEFASTQREFGISYGCGRVGSCTPSEGFLG